VNHLAKFGHSYGTKEEYEYRRQIFFESDKEIKRVNSDPDMTWTAAHNIFSTMNEAEKDRYTGALEMPEV
jgi:hypothetical protein